MSLLNSTKEKVNQAKTDLLSKSIMEQISHGGADYIDGFEKMYSRLNKKYVPRNEYWRILMSTDLSGKMEEYHGDGCYTWRQTGGIYLVTRRNELGVSFQIFDTLKSTQLTCHLEGEPIPPPGDPYSEFRMIKTRPNLSVIAYREERHFVVVDKYTHIFTIDNADRPFVEELFKEGHQTADELVRKMIHDYNYSWPMLFDPLVAVDNAPKNTIF